MRLRDTIISILSASLAVVLLAAAGMQLDFINSQRKEMRLISNEPLENAPPALAFATVAMGAFRGLVVDVLWLRAEKLKDEGQFFDAKQIAEWLTTLQPRFAQIWEMQAWNMAYNISAAIPASQPAERWRWVKNGFELLRDKGIPLNPKSILLYRELARIFQDKIGSWRDDVHKYYKQQLLLAMEPLLGPADNEHFKALSEAPAQLQHLMDDENIVRLITQLKSADSAFADDDAFVSNYLSLRQNAGKFDPKALKVIDSFRGTPALEEFDIFARAYHLRSAWKLDPVLMQQLNQTYGPVDLEDANRHLPLDWRHPDTHAIYWAVKGLQVAGREGFSVPEANTDRIVSHSLQSLFREGRIFVYEVSVDVGDESGGQTTQKRTKEIFLRPDLRMFDSYNQSQLAVIEKYKDLKKGTHESLQIAHRHMLVNACLAVYQAGHSRQAQRIYNQLRELYPRDEFNVPLAAFVKNRFRKEFKAMTVDNAQEDILSMLRESYFRFAVRDDDEAASLEKLAKEIHDYYQSLYDDQTRIDLPDFKLLKYFALLDFFNDEQYPSELRQNMYGRMRVERPELAEQFWQQHEEMLKRLEQQK